MKIRRDIASVPLRSAKDTWRAIVDLVTGDGSVDRQQLDAASSTMESIIADELPAKTPIVFKGVGPRVLVYCLYNEDAMEAGLDIGKLGHNPTAGEWRATAPSETEDVDWMNSSLKTRAPRIAVHDVDQPPADQEASGAEETTGKAFEIDWGALVKS